MTVDELLEVVVPLPLSGPGYGQIRYCNADDIKSAMRCIERNQKHYEVLVNLLPVLDRLRYRFKRDETANVVEDLRYFALKTAITGPKYSRRLKELRT